MNKTVFREVHLVMLGREDMYWDLDLGFSFQKAHIYIFLKYAILSNIIFKKFFLTMKCFHGETTSPFKKSYLTT